MKAMKLLSRAEDPTGFLNLFRFAATQMHGDGRGFIQSRGRYASPTKKGPGRRAEGWTGLGECRHGAKHLGKNVTPRGY